jgi:hypothetical protein
MMKFIAFLTALSFVSSPLRSLAAEPVPEKISLPKIETPRGEDDVGAAISPMHKGLRAPFTGLLLSPLAVATLMAELSSYQEMLDIETRKIKQEYEADIEFRLKKLKIENEADTTILKAELATHKSTALYLEDQLQKEINNRPNVFLWASLGVVGGIGITLLTAFAVAQVSN